MALVVPRSSSHLARPHRQERLGSFQRLDLRLLVEAEHESSFRRVEVEPDDIANLLHKERVRREFERLLAMRLEPEGLPDPRHRGTTDPYLRSERAKAPVAGVAGHRR